MKSLESYAGREQTYVKHFFLEHYLERVAYNIGSFADEFVYVDGFSGPWKAVDDALEDTSFMIAIRKLREVRDGLAKAGKNRRIRCLFVEKDTTSFRSLEAAVKDATDVGATTLNGEFEDVIPEILRFVGGAFSLVFIDPTGWTGFGLEQIAPLLRHRPGEVLVNFMFDHANRFLDEDRADTAASFNDLFGGGGWEHVVGAGPDRERAMLALYRDRLRDIGGFRYVTSTRILKPTSDRAYFYLVYGTRHPKGLIEFRRVEREAVEEQERVRLAAKQDRRLELTGQRELFEPAVLVPGPPSFEDERRAILDAAGRALDDLLQASARVRYEDALAALLESALLWEGDVKVLIEERRKAGRLEIQGLGPRERTPKPGHFLVRVTR